MMIARAEAELQLQGPPRFMNQALLEVIPNRTLESIKSQRRRPDYREAVYRFLQTLPPDQPGDDHQQEATPVAQQLLPTPVQDGSRHILEFVLGLEEPRAVTHNIQMLLDIVRNAKDLGKEQTLVRIAAYLNITFPPPKKNNSPTGMTNRTKN